MVNIIEISMGGNPYKLRFDNLTLQIFFKKVDFEIFEASSKYAAVYAGLKSYFYAKGEPMMYLVEGKNTDLTWEVIYGWVNEMSAEDLNKVKVAFEEMESYKQTVTGLKKVLTELTPAEAKKKLEKPKKRA